MNGKADTSVKGVILAVVAAMAYGTIPIFSKVVLRTGLNAVTILCYRHFMCVIILAAACFGRRNRATADNAGKGLKTAALLRWTALGAFVYAVQSGLYMLAIERIDASITTMLFCTYPIFVPFLMAIFGREKISRSVFLCAFSALFGLWLLLGTRTGIKFNTGMAFGLGAGLIYALYIFLGSLIDSGETGPLEKTLCILFGAFLGFTVSGLISHTLEFRLTADALMILIAMALICNILSTACFWMSVSYIGAARASLIGILEPVTSMILTVVILREALTLLQILGIVIILLSIAAVQYTDG